MKTTSAPKKRAATKVAGKSASFAGAKSAAKTAAKTAKPKAPAAANFAVKGELTIDQRKQLRAQAHDLKPVAQIGNNGVTPAVLAEIELQLNAHGLIKIKAPSDDRAEREAWLKEIIDATDAASVQHIGKTLVIYRKKTKIDEKMLLPSHTRWARNKEPSPGVKRPAALQKGKAKGAQAEPEKKKFYYGEGGDMGALSPKERYSAKYGPKGRAAGRAKPVTKAVSKSVTRFAQASEGAAAADFAAPKPFGSVGRRRSVSPSGFAINKTGGTGTSPRSRSPMSRQAAKSRSRTKT